MTSPVSLTISAARRVAAIAEKLGKPPILRLSVDGGGCAGFSYSFALGDPAPHDARSVTDGVTLVVDPVSLDLVAGSAVDYVEDLGGAARHMGIDLAGPTGTPIYATADGVVSESGYNNGGYGNLIKLDHGRGVETRYGHLSAMLVAAGQRVARGQLIARMGSTGRSTGSHLHYEVRIEGKAVNPIPFKKSTDYLLAMQKSGGGVSMDNHAALGGPQSAARR